MIYVYQQRLFMKNFFRGHNPLKEHNQKFFNLIFLNLARVILIFLHELHFYLVPLRACIIIAHSIIYI